MIHLRPHRLLSKQAGMVSIFVTMIMMVVISLIVLGFAQVSRREQRASLDRQLSSEAFFAAESGVNDARQTIAGLPAGAPIPEKKTCGKDPSYTANPLLDSTNQISYSCLLVTSQATTIRNQLVANGNSVNEPLEPVGGPIQTIHINWQPDNTPGQGNVSSKCAAKVPASAEFSTNTNWTCPYGVLRVDLVSTDTLTRGALAASQKTMFLYPTHGVGSGNQPYATSNGAVAAMRCKATTGCNIDMSGVNLSGATTYAMRLSALYVGGNFTISATAAGGAALPLQNAQIQVDSTGKAQDVLRRVLVSLPLQSSGPTPDFAIESASSVCKRFTITGNSFSIPGDIQGQDQNNPTCVPAAVNPPPTTCTNRVAGNHVVNGDFALGAGSAPTVDTAIYGFSTMLPNRGADTFPDDQGKNGDAALNLKDWSGGLSVLTTGPQLLNGGAVLYTPFMGDSSVTPAVNGVDSGLYTNPNQTVTEPQITEHVNDTFTGSLWSTTLFGLKGNTTYDFSGYFLNPLTTLFTTKYPTYWNPKIQFSIDGLSTNGQIDVPVPNTTDPTKRWQHVSQVFTTKLGQTSATFSINDFGGHEQGDDFVMTQLGVYECK